MNEKNTPNVDNLQAQLAELGITPKATVREMHKQVKKALKQKAVEKKQEKLLEFARIQNEMKDSRPQPFAYYLVLDFEGTCDENSRFDYASEIIEFPVILIDGQTLQIVDQFHRYVRPILQPTLTEFCISLTGITQEMVDKADPFDQVYNEFKTWLETYCPKPFNDCVFVTDGPWDLRDFFEKEITYYGMVRPDYMKSIINLRKQFQDYYKTSGNLNSMLSFLKMEFQGRPHSGIDDATNLARIFLHMANDGCRMDINTKLRKIKKSKWAQLRK